MITYRDVRLAINRQLEQTGIEITSRDVSEGFSRPSFFVQLNNNVRSADENQVHKSMTVQIYYFPTNRYEYSVEVLDMQETLENLFDLKLPVKDRWLNVDEFSSFLNDGVLNVSFDLEFYDGRFYNGEENDLIDREFPPRDTDGNPKYEDVRERHPVEKMYELEIEKVEE